MSLWTPSGEHPVGRDRPSDTSAPSEAGEAPEEPLGPTSLDDLDPEDRARAEALAAELSEARERLASMPAATVVANHAMGLYELAAIHLGQQPPDLAEASLAIDAMGGLLDATTGRLDENEAVLKEAMHQLKMAFVQLSSQAGEREEAAPATDD